MKRLIYLVVVLGCLLPAVDAFPQQSACYAAPAGRDSNDGSSWTSAKRTVMGCYDALPPRGGSIYIGDMTAATSVPGQGIWILGRNDPNYFEPPLGWRRQKGAVRFVGDIGYSGGTWEYNSKAGVVSIIAGSRADNNHPGIWLSGVTIHHFSNLNVNGGRAILIGENSNHVRSPNNGGSCVAITFDNVGAQSQGANNGPTVDLTGGSFWLRFYHDVFYANTQAVSAADVSGAAIFLDGRLGYGASVEIEDISIGGGGTGGGGIMVYPSTQSVDYLYVHRLTSEALQGVPAVWIRSSSVHVNASISDAALADSVGTTPAVQVDGGGPPDNVTVSNVQFGSTVGSMTISGVSPQNGWANQAVTPQQAGQVGTAQGRLFGQIDNARRNFPPTVARFINLAHQQSSTWKGQPTSGYCNAYTNNPVAAPDGTTNAGELTSSSGQNAACFYTNDSLSLSVGDWIIAGVWVRAETTSGYVGNTVMGVQILNGTLTSSGSGTPPWKGNEEWEWICTIAQVATVTNPGLHFMGYAEVSTPTDFFAPVLLHIPAGSISSSEAAELAVDLQSYRDDAVPGQVSLLRGEQLKADSIQVGDGPTITSGKGTPKGSASPGSVYLRRDGGAGSTFYIYENGEWKAKF